MEMENPPRATPTSPFVPQVTEDGHGIPGREGNNGYKNLFMQILVAMCVSVAALVAGFAFGYSAPALATMLNPYNIYNRFPITAQQAYWIHGAVLLSAVAGGIIGGPLIEYLGRRNTILAMAPTMLVSWLLIACALRVWMVLCGRALSGICVGVLSLSLPIYLGEILQPKIRGSVGLLPACFNSIGMLLVFGVGKYLDWVKLACLGIGLALLFLALMFVVPESPRWLGKRGEAEKAQVALQRLRGRGTDISYELETTCITDQRRGKVDVKNVTSSSPRDLFHKLKPLLICLGLMFFQNITGLNVVYGFFLVYLTDAKRNLGLYLAGIVVSAVPLGGVLISTALIDRLGRKFLLYISAGIMAFSLITLATFLTIMNSGIDVSKCQWFPLVSCIVYNIGYFMGFGTIPWLMMGEILPSKIRWWSASIVTAFSWACALFVQNTDHHIIIGMGMHTLVWIFSIISLVALVFVKFCVPETRGKSLEEIENEINGITPDASV